MKIVFLGTPDFAVASLDILVRNGYDIAAVVTAPDKPAGRGQKLSESAVKIYAREKGLKVLQPEKLKDEKFIDELRRTNADLFIVVAFRMLPEVVWKMPKLGTFNLHASLLPQYRGAAPINWVIMNGEKKTGVTTFFLQQEIDTGKIIFQEETAIEPGENAGSLHDRLMQMGSELVLKTVKALEKGDLPVKDQSELIKGLVKEAPKIFKENCRINWSKDSSTILNLIRGLSPYPSAWTTLVYPDGKELDIKIFKGIKKPEAGGRKPEAGQVYTDNKTYLSIGCADGALNILELQLSGKRKMNIEEVLRGNQFPAGIRVKLT